MGSVEVLLSVRRMLSPTHRLLIPKLITGAGVMDTMELVVDVQKYEDVTVRVTLKSPAEAKTWLAVAEV